MTSFAWPTSGGFVVDLRDTSTSTSTPWRSWFTHRLDSGTGGVTYDPAYFYTIYNNAHAAAQAWEAQARQWMSPPTPRLEDDLVALYDDPGGDLP
jgi:hypothetical protein